jgi:uncharacterized peroxidase-related enzyme
MSAWIHLVPLEEATGPLKEMYELAKTPSGTVDNVMRAHSLRPHTMEGHLKLYRSVLHHPENTLPLWFLEAVGVYTSLLNECVYSFTHHCANMRRLLEDEGRGQEIEDALRAQAPEQAFSGKELALICYTGKLTLTPGKVSEADILEAREAGATDGEILEVNQVCAYFCYSNRTLNGLGVQLGTDAIGYYQPNGPSSDS